MEEQQRIKNFMNDKATSRAVYNALLDSFLAERPNSDVHTLAASRLAIDFLKLGWKHLRSLSENDKERSLPEGNVGL